MKYWIWWFNIMWCWLSLKIIDFIQSFSSILETFLTHLLVHCHPFRFQNETWENRSRALGTWSARPAGLLPEGGWGGPACLWGLSSWKACSSCPHREWPPAASVPGAERRVRVVVPGVRVEISTHPVPQRGRALGLLFPALKPHGFGSLKNPSCVQDQWGEEWLAISNVLSITWTPDTRPLQWWGQSGHSAE